MKFQKSLFDDENRATGSATKTAFVLFLYICICWTSKPFGKRWYVCLYLLVPLLQISRGYAIFEVCGKNFLQLHYVLYVLI